MKAFIFFKGSLLFVLLALLFVGCSNKEPYIPQTHIVEIKDMKFQPADLTVHIGDTVIWVNKDIVAHDVTQDNKDWASPPLASEATWKKEVTMSDAYYCSIHVVMKGKLTVED